VRPEGQADPGRHRKATATSFALAALGVVAAGAIVLLAQADPAKEGSSASTTVAPPVTTTAPPETTTTTVPFFETLRAVVPQVDGDLLAVIGQSTLRLVSWPSDGAKDIRGIGAWTGPALEVDRSGAYLAFLGPAEAGEDSALFVGDRESWHPLTVNVDSFRWHTRDPERIAWTGGGLLCHGLVHPDGGFLSLRCLVDVTGLLLGFDDDGFLIAPEPGVVARLDTDGVEQARTDGDDALIGPDGRILIIRHGRGNDPDATAFVTTDPELSRVSILEWAPAEASGAYGMVAWSPTASPPELAFLVPSAPGTYQVQRWSLDGRMLAGPVLSGRYWNIEWDWSGRYLLTPGVTPGGDHVIHVYDTVVRQHFELGATDWVQDVHLVNRPSETLTLDPGSVLRFRPVR